jgi:serine/threonine protein kinase
MPKTDPSMDFGPTTQQFDPVYTRDALPAGTRLGGYQLIEVLGRGGFGIVYLALDASLQRQVAIKEYFPAELALRCDDGQVWVKPGADVTAYSSGMKAFLNEAKMLARFDHPSLARVLTFWEENRSAYMVMPYYEGRTLAEVLAEMSTPPDEAWLRALLSPLLSALSTLHNAHCLHLDISPENIIVLADGRPVLLDFGVASRLATDKTMPLTALLNPAYAPIEQYSESANLQQGAWSDVYALAGVLHFAIAGVPPARATVRAVDDPQRPLAETVAARAQQFPGLSYSPSFLAAIDKALAFKPRDRPRGAAEFQMLLDRPLQDPSPSPEPNTGPASEFPPPGSSYFSDSIHAPWPSPPPAAAADAWLAAEPMDAPPRPTRSRAPMWIASVAALGLGIAAWAWLQRQPSWASITVADLPPAVVANIPKAPTEAASGVALQTEPSGAGPAGAAAPVPAPAPAPAPAPSASAPAVVATAPVTAPATVEPTPEPESSAAAPAPAPAASAAPQAAPPAAAKPAAPPKARVVAKAAPAPRATTPAQTPSPAAPDDSAPAKAEDDDPTKPTRTAEAANAAARKQPAAKSTASALPPEPATPRAACGGRSNFALVYCMQQQCKRWKFNTHPQCLEAERRGEL